MKYLQVTERDGRYRAALLETKRPSPGQGEVLLRVAASGLNRADLSQIAGKYPPPPGEPEILGLEVSGTLEETHERVCALLAGGGHAEFVAVPRGQVFPVPARVDLVSAAAIPEAFLTAFTNLAVEASLKRGEQVLIRAGASGVGLAAIQVSKLLGASVAATTRTKEKTPALLEAGADLAIDTSAGALQEIVQAWWGADCVDVILDPVGRETLREDLSVLRLGGRIVFLATLSGSLADLDVSLLMRKRGRLIGSTLRSRSREEKSVLVERFRRDLLPAFDSGGLQVSIDSVFLPEDAARAFERMRQNRNIGKILIDWTKRGRGTEGSASGPLPRTSRYWS